MSEYDIDYLKKMNDAGKLDQVYIMGALADLNKKIDLLFAKLDNKS